VKQNLKAKWIEALRSGKFEQIKGSLRARISETPTEVIGHCCLGVLCEVADLPKAPMLSGYTFQGGHWRNGTPSTLFLDEIDLDRQDVDELVNLNDNLEKSFEEIADYIEANIPGDPE
jgi:hypothetical protein